MAKKHGHAQQHGHRAQAGAGGERPKPAESAPAPRPPATAAERASTPRPPATVPGTVTEKAPVPRPPVTIQATATAKSTVAVKAPAPRPPEKVAADDRDAQKLPPDFKASVMSSFEKFNQLRARSNSSLSSSGSRAAGEIPVKVKQDIKSSIAKFNEMLEKAPSRPLPSFYQQRHAHKLYKQYVVLQEAQLKEELLKDQERFSQQQKLALLKDQEQSMKPQQPQPQPEQPQPQPPKRPQQQDWQISLQPNATPREAGGQPELKSLERKSMSYGSPGPVDSPTLNEVVNATRRNSHLQFLTETLAALRPSSSPSSRSTPFAAGPSAGLNRLAEIPEIPPFKGGKKQAGRTGPQPTPPPDGRPPSREVTNGDAAFRNGAQSAAKRSSSGKREQSPLPKEKGFTAAEERGGNRGERTPLSVLKSMPGRSASDNALFPLRPSPSESSDFGRLASPAHKAHPATPEQSFEKGGKRYTAEDAKQLPLRYPWTLYYDCRTNAGPKHVFGKKENYESNLQTIYTFQDVFSFCGVMNNVKRPVHLDVNSNLHLFKNGIKPMWEDPANMRGGKWTFTLSNKHHTARPELCDRLWLNLAMAVVGEQFREDVCGIVVSRRNRGDRLSVWTSNALDRQKVERLREEIIKFADMGGENLPMDFATHEAALATTPK